MRIEPKLDEVVNGERGMLPSIQLLLEKEFLVSAVALMFSAMDAIAALDRPLEAKRTTRSVFVKWVEEYFLPRSDLHCTALELYAARCGVLHTYSPESDLARPGEVRKLVYEWRGGPKADATIAVDADSLAIQVEALHEALTTGVKRFLVAAEMDDATRARVHHHLPTLLCYEPWPTLRVQVAA